MSREEPLSLVFVCTAWRSEAGGIQTVNRELALAAAALGHHVTCVVQSPRSDESDSATASGVKLIRGGEHYLESVRFVQQTRPDFVIGHSAFTGEAARELAHLAAAHWLQVVHFDPEDNESWKLHKDARFSTREARSAKELELCAAATAVACLGPRLYTDFSNRLKALGAGGTRVLRVDGGAELRELRPLPTAAEILMLARVESIEGKGLDIGTFAVAEAFKQLQWPSASLRLRIRGGLDEAGRRHAEGILTEIAREACPDELLTLQVLQYDAGGSQVPLDLNRARLLLMPSRVEGYGLVALEALARGVPVLVSGASGVADLMKEASSVAAERLILPVTADYQTAGRAWGKRIAQALKEPQPFEESAQRLRQDLNARASWEQAARHLCSFLQNNIGPRQHAVGVPPNINVDYLKRLQGDQDEQLVLARCADEHYSRARRAANEGNWDESYREHLVGLAIWRHLDNRPRLARSLGRIAWCLVASGDVQAAIVRLEQASHAEPLQGAAGWFWAAQYCFRAGQDVAAATLLTGFVRRCFGARLVDPASISMFSPAAPLKFIEQFYEALLLSEDRLGWGDLSWSDRGRLCLVKAAIEEQRAIELLQQASEFFEKCGLTSYVRFCDGKRCLLTLRGLGLSSSNRIQLLTEALHAFNAVSQRFVGQAPLLDSYCAVIEAQIAVCRFELAQEDDPNVSFGSVRTSVIESLSRGLQDLVSPARDQLLLLLDYLAGTAAAGPILANVGPMFSAIHRALPDLEGYYLPALTTALQQELAQPFKGVTP